MHLNYIQGKQEDKSGLNIRLFIKSII
jgi:hypothetical protein